MRFHVKRVRKHVVGLRNGKRRKEKGWRIKKMPKWRDWNMETGKNSNDYVADAHEPPSPQEKRVVPWKSRLMLYSTAFCGRRDRNVIKSGIINGP